MRDPKTMPLIAVQFELADGSTLEREWTSAELEDGCERPTWLQSIPDWLEESAKSWPHPQDPITFTGRVKPGREAEAIATVNS